MARWAAQPNMVRTRLGKHDVAGLRIVPCRAATAEAQARHERRVVVLCRHDGRVGPHGSCRLKPDGGCSRSGSDGEAHLNEVVVTARRAGEEAVMTTVRTRQQLLLDLPACLAATVSSSEPPRVSGRHLLLLMCLTVTTFLLPHTPRCRRLLLPTRLIVAASTDDAERD